MLDTKIARVKELISQKEAVDTELATLLGGEVKKTITCSKCQAQGHTARSCPQREHSQA